MADGGGEITVAQRGRPGAGHRGPQRVLGLLDQRGGLLPTAAGVGGSDSSRRAAPSDWATLSCSSAASCPRVPSSAATRPESSSNMPVPALSASRR